MKWLKEIGARCAIVKPFVLALCLLAIALPVQTDALEPSFDCARTDSSAEDEICKNDDLAALDLEITRLYRLAIEGPYMTVQRRSTLKAEQRGWIKGRNECWKASTGLEPCVAGSYVMRIDEVRTGYADARSDDANGKSTGPFAYLCDGLDAFVSAVFVGAGTRHVSLRWRDNWIVLEDTGIGSGGRYTSDFYETGTYVFTMKNDLAIFVRPGVSDLTCHLEPTG